MNADDVNIERYLRIRNQTQTICQPLELEDYVVQPSPQVSPPKWHLAHSTWFFEKFIANRYIDGYNPYSPIFEHLFNSYYKSCGKHWLQPQRGFLSRPTVKEVLNYRHHIDGLMQELLNQPHLSHDEHFKMLIEVGLHHEQQHQELLLMDIKYILAINPSYPSYCASPFKRIPESSLSWIDIEAGLYPIGASNNRFCYDNEKPQYSHYQHSSAIANRLVTNQEYQAFIEDKAYQNPLLWLSDGWDWVQASNKKAPLYWQNIDKQWHEYTLHGLAPIDKHAPVSHINYYEACAYAKWSGVRLPSEQELEIYLSQHRSNTQDSALHVSPFSHSTTDKQLWAWTQSDYNPYPGYQAFQGELGEYNGKFMCNQRVLRGGCFATPEDHYRPTYRNFYFPHQNWMFSGICLAKDS